MFIERAVPIMIGLPLIATGFGLTAAFGIFAFIGIPLLAIGLSCVSVAVDSNS
jgi:predicted RND superfamily exporter protein